jgi:ABC-type multidrug transport system ATPase subunit
MEEAEALCQRIGIMAKGALRCLGPALRLKELYGSGFKLFFNSLAADTPRACAFIEKLLPEGWRKADAFTTNSSYEFPGGDGVIGGLFREVGAGKDANGIIDWGLAETSLEEVFLRIISDEDANAD